LYYASVTNRDADGSQLEFGDDEQTIALRKAWDRTLRALAPKLTPTSKTYLAETEPLSWNGEIVVLAARTRFARVWLEDRHGEALRSHLAINLEAPSIRIRFVIATGDTDRTPLEPRLPAEAESDEQSSANEKALVTINPSGQRGAIATSKRKPIPPDMSMPLSPKFTFDQFVVGKSNRLAHASALAVAQNPGRAYNPLYLYGSPGLGKTHLMHAIGQAILADNPNARIAYVSGESFTNCYIASLRDNKSDQFRSVYRGVDVWLVDDIQSIAGKEHTKEEFFHTFNTLHQTGKQIVLTSDKPPRDLRLMDDRLRTRFEAGLMADVSAPEIETRIAILQRKAEAEGIDVDEEVLAYMAGLIQSNIRSLEGALTSVAVRASLSGTKVTKDLARDVLGAFFVENRRVVSDTANAALASERSPLVALPLPTIANRLGSHFRTAEEQVQRIIDTVAEHYQLDPSCIAGDGSAALARRRDISTPRQIAIYLCREKTHLPVTELARIFGNVDHSAITHAHKKMIANLAKTPDLLTTIQAVLDKV
jgi:chromosomal replication initiator protein